ncbi:hypothetical protein [Rhizobium sp. No.120]
MAKPGVTMTKDAFDDVLKSIRSLTKQEVLIGVPDENAGRQPEEGEKEEPISNAEIGYVMEFGLPEKNIPARPHLVPGVEAATGQLGNILQAGAEKALAGDKQAVDIALNKAGLAGQNSVRKKVNEGPFQELSEKTLAARKRRGRTGEKPLLDTLQYLKSLTYVIRPKGK